MVFARIRLQVKKSVDYGHMVFLIMCSQVHHGRQKIERQQLQEVDVCDWPGACVRGNQKPETRAETLPAEADKLWQSSACSSTKTSPYRNV